MISIMKIISVKIVLKLFSLYQSYTRFLKVQKNALEEEDSGDTCYVGEWPIVQL